MNDSIIAWSTFALAGLTIILIIFGYYQLYHLVKSQNLATLSEYLKRYNTIVGKIPLIYFDPEFNPIDLVNNQKKELLQVMFEYWNFVAEEFMFKRRGWIDFKIWEGWERGIEYHLKKNHFFVWSWEEISKTHRYNRILREFMESNILNNKMN